jgi:hypothetical protein
MKYFDELLEDRENPYEINLELKIRKMLEEKTDYTFELQKNSDPYGYDLEVFKYYIDGADWQKKSICFIEIEISETWKNDYPSNWRWYSFLSRKILDDYSNGDNIKINAEKTIYIIFNKLLTDSICLDMMSISKFDLQHQKITGVERNDYYLRVPVNDKRVIRGLKNSMNYIWKYINKKSEINE